MCAEKWPVEDVRVDIGAEYLRTLGGGKIQEG